MPLQGRILGVDPILHPGFRREHSLGYDLNPELDDTHLGRTADRTELAGRIIAAFSTPGTRCVHLSVAFAPALPIG